MRVLVIESSVHIANRLQELLAEVPCVTDSFAAASADAAGQALVQLKPRVVLLDAALPDGEATHLLATIRRQSRSIAVIALCTAGNGHQTEGADYTLDKYHDFEKLPQTLNAIAEKER